MARETLKASLMRILSVEAEGTRPVTHVIFVMWAMLAVVTLTLLVPTLLTAFGVR